MSLCSAYVLEVPVSVWDSFFLVRTIGLNSHFFTHLPCLNCLFGAHFVTQVEDLELLLMHNDIYCAQISRCVSAKKRVEIVERADEMRVRVLNRDARLRHEEK
eukprot:Selendium_serpulae@DN4833_c0_g1_i1.p4